MYWGTRADDLIVKAMIGLLERNPNLPKERVDDVAIAATTQEGDQGLTLGRTAAILAGLPMSVPGYAIDRMCAGAMTAVATTAGGIAFRALSPALEITALPGVFAAGEMLDWEAPTGGYLLTACLATGRWAGRAAARRLGGGN